MARPRKFTDDQLLDAALSAVAKHGRAASIAQVSAEIAAPVGSIYHRFASRDALFIALWLRSIRRFHVGIIEATKINDAEAALAATAVHVPRYCRDHPDEAYALTLYRHGAVVRSAPEALREPVRVVNTRVEDAMTDLCRRRYGRVTAHRLELITTAVQQSPYGLVRPYVGGDVPSWLDDVVVAAANAIIELGDRSMPEKDALPGGREFA